MGLVGSQAGHLLAYAIRFGGASTQLQSSGPHAYFPLVAKTDLGLAAALLVAGLFVIGLARSVSGRPLRREQPPVSYLSMLAALFTVQLGCFAVQETAEAYLNGAPASSATVLLLWGTLGQLPVAVASALAIRWLLTRFSAAVTEILNIAALMVPPPRPVPAAILVPNQADPSLLLSQAAGPSLAKRGPPYFLRLTPS